MKNNDLFAALNVKLESRNIKTGTTSIRHLNDLQKEIEEKHEGGHLDDAFYRKWLAQFKFSITETLNTAKSIIVTATPQPQERVMFIWQGQSYPFIIPPTYLYHTDKLVQAVLEEVLGPHGYKIEKPVLPVKLLAVSCGLAQYGRNNIAYIEGLGSFFRLKAFFTDLPGAEDAWLEPRVMEACTHCRACEKSCPTKAIHNDRFLIHAERCLTYFNEGEEAFPEWLNPAWHNCLVGCLKCQLVCPQNKPFKNWIEDRVIFEEAETELLLKGAPREVLAAETAGKLEKIGMLEYLEMLPRNLSVLLHK
jgi:epoxyqueuosine reductase